MSPPTSVLHACWPLQDEFKFYLEDAKSKLLLVPSDGNKAAQGAASSLGVPAASFTMQHTRGTHKAGGPPGGFTHAAWQPSHHARLHERRATPGCMDKGRRTMHRMTWAVRIHVLFSFVGQIC